MNFIPKSLLCCFCALALLSCTTLPEVSSPSFSGITPQDVRDLKLLIAGRADILKPIIRGHLVRPGKAVLVTGHDSKVGDSFDTFTTMKRNGTWTIDSPVKRDRVVVTSAH